MQKAVVVCLDTVDKKHFVTVDEFNTLLEDGWEVENQDPIGKDFNYNLIVLEKKDEMTHICLIY